MLPFKIFLRCLIIGLAVGAFWMIIIDQFYTNPSVLMGGAGIVSFAFYHLALANDWWRYFERI